MPKLPDVTSFGGRPALQGRGGVPSGDGSGIQRAASIFSRSAQDQAAGAAELGQSLARTGEILRGAEERHQARLDAVKYAKAITRFSQEAQGKLRDIETTQDLSDESAFEAGLGALDATASGVLSSAGLYSKDKAADLNADIINTRNSLVNIWRQKSYEASESAVDLAWQATVNELTGKISVDPSRRDEFEMVAQARLNQMADGISQHKQDQLWQNFQSLSSYRTIDRMIDRGKFD